VPSSLVAVLDKRIPLVSLSNITVDKGDGPTGTARVPFHTVGDLTSRASFTVFVAGDRGILDRGTVTVDLAPGQTEGSIPIDFLADKVDDFDSTQTYRVASAGQGVMTNRFLGILTVLDDDPAPQITVAAVKKTVAEGQSASWRVSLSGRTDYSFEVLAQPVHGTVSVPRLTKGDVSPAWIRLRASESGPDTTPLEKLGINVASSKRGSSPALPP
jgi:hypothetical protein